MAEETSNPSVPGFEGVMRRFNHGLFSIIGLPYAWDYVTGVVTAPLSGLSVRENIDRQIARTDAAAKNAPVTSVIADTVGGTTSFLLGGEILAGGRLLGNLAASGLNLVRGVVGMGRIAKTAELAEGVAAQGVSALERKTSAIVDAIEQRIASGTAKPLEGTHAMARTPGRGAPRGGRATGTEGPPAAAPEVAETAAGPSAAGNVAANSARGTRSTRAAEKTAAERAEKLAYAKQLKEAGLDGETVAAMVTQEFSKPTGWMGMVPSWIRNSTVVVGLLGAGAGVFYAATHVQDLAADLGAGRMKVPFTDWNLFGLRGHAKAGELEATAGVAKPVEARTDTAEPHPAATETEAQKALRLKRERQKAEGFEDHSSLGVSSPTLTSLDEKVGTRASLRLASVTDTVGEGTRDLKGQPVKANTPIAPSITV